MPNIRNGKTEEVVAQNLGLGGCIADSHTKDKEQAVEIGELVG